MIVKNSQKSQRKNDFKARRTTKITSLIIVSTFFLFFLIGNVSAFDFDNKLTYEDNDMKVRFNDCSVWIGTCLVKGDELGTIELKSHKNVEEILEFGFGKEEVVMYYDFEGWNKGELGEVTFIDKNTGEEIDKDYSFVVWDKIEIDNYVETCTTKTNEYGHEYKDCISTKDGTKEVDGWVRFDDKKIKNKRIGIKTYVEDGDYIDAVWTIGGKKVKKHAEWTAGLNTGITGYWTLDEAAGNLVDSVNGNDGVNTGADQGQDGKIGNSINLTKADNDHVLMGTHVDATTINFWLDIGSVDAGWNFMYINAPNLSIITFDSNKWATYSQGTSNGVFNGDTLPNENGWHMMTFVHNVTGVILYEDGVEVDFQDALYPLLFQRIGWTTGAFDGSIDEVGTWGRDLSDAEITQLYNGGTGITFVGDFDVAPKVTLNTPINNSNLTSIEVNFNCSASDDDNLINVSLILDSVVNETNSTGINNTFYYFDKTMSSGDHNWSCRAADNNSLVNTTEIRLFDVNVSMATVLVTPTDAQEFNDTTITLIFNSTTVNQDLVFGNTTIWHSNGTTFVDNSTSLSGLSDVQTSFTNTVPDGNYIWGASTTGNQTTNSTENRTFSIHTTPSTIIIDYPKGNIESFAIGDNLDLNWSITEPGQNLSAHIKNCSYTYNSVETFLNLTICVEINTTTFLYADGVNDLLFTVVEEFNLTTTNTTSWTFSFLETGVTFEGNVSETSSQTLDINLTTDIDVQSIAAILTYNGTNYTSTSSCDESGNCMISNTLDVPLVGTGEFDLYDFFWNLAIFNGTASSSITTSTRQQNATRIYLEECNATYPHVALNFTVYDERSLVPINPYSFNGTFGFWIGNGAVKRDNSIANTGLETTICLQPNVTVKIDSTIDYDASTTNDYTNRFYYFDGHEISNSSQSIFMYLLNTSSSTSFILKVQDDSLLPISSALIEVHRFYPGEGIFRIVQIAKTDDNGKSIGFFETETVDYKFIIKKGGSTLLETGVQKVVPETSPFTLTFNTGEPLDEPWITQIPKENLTSSLGWNSSSGIVSYIYTDSSGNFTQSRLLVIRQSLTNSSADTTICNYTSVLISATIVCNSTFTNGVYIASAFNTRNGAEALDLDKQFTFQVESLSGVVGLLGLFYGWFLILIASFMFKFNEIAGIWAVTITVFLINLSGLINFGGVFVTATIALAIIITWVLER